MFHKLQHIIIIVTNMLRLLTMSLHYFLKPTLIQPFHLLLTKSYNYPAINHSTNQRASRDARHASNPQTCIVHTNTRNPVLITHQLH